MDEKLVTHIRSQNMIRPSLISDDLMYNNKILNHKSDYYTMVKYIDKFLNGENINRYFVLPGIRDVGKSTILFQIYNYLLREKHIKPTNIMYISVDTLKQISNSSIMDAIEVYLKITFDSTIYTVKEPVFLLIDEAQYDKDWSLTGKIMFDASKKIFMVFSGSSALDLSYNADSARRLLRIPITPLNFSEHLKLKYDYHDNNISNEICDLVFNANTDNITKLNMKIIEAYSDINKFNLNEWDEFLKFGGFPSGLFQEKSEIMKTIVNTVDKVVSIDMNNLGGIYSKSLDVAYHLLYFFALQHPGEVSYDSMANNIDSNKNTVKKVLDVLIRTQIIFDIEAFTSSPKRSTKPKKYYYATSSIKHIMSSNLGNAILENENAYMGKLLENLVASTLFNIENKRDFITKTYYDNAKKSSKNVDFIVQRGLEHPIPIEVSYGKKDKSQIVDAIKRYKASHGIIISDTTPNIVQKDNVIYIPPEIFAFM